MDAIERAADVSVGRACGFCALAIFCFMVGFSYEPHLSARVGGLFSFAVTLVLAFKALTAERRPYRRTETWLMLLEEERPSPAAAQAVIGLALKAAFVRYARYSAVLTLLLLAAAVILAFAFG